MIDNYDLFEMHEREMEKAEKEWEERRPVCSLCKQKIYDRDAYLIDGDIICCQCVRDSRFDTEW